MLIVLLTKLAPQSLLNSLKEEVKLINLIVYLQLHPLLFLVVPPFLLVPGTLKVEEGFDNSNMPFTDVEEFISLIGEVDVVVVRSLDELRRNLPQVQVDLLVAPPWRHHWILANERSNISDHCFTFLLIFQSISRVIEDDIGDQASGLSHSGVLFDLTLDDLHVLLDVRHNNPPVIIVPNWTFFLVPQGYSHVVKGVLRTHRFLHHHEDIFMLDFIQFPFSSLQRSLGIFLLRRRLVLGLFSPFL